MSIITITPLEQNLSVAESSASGMVVISENSYSPTIITVNQGQQGPAGSASFVIDNYGNNRIITSDGTSDGLYAESNLVFDGSALRVNNTEVSLAGHSHTSADITNMSVGVYSALSGLSSISNTCDVKYVLIQNATNDTKLISINSIIKSIGVIDGGGVIYSGC